jgi:hypothetical protein
MIAVLNKTALNQSMSLEIKNFLNYMQVYPPMQNSLNKLQ